MLAFVDVLSISILFDDYDDVFGLFLFLVFFFAFTCHCLSFLLFWTRQIVRSRVFILLFFFFLLACLEKSVEEQACGKRSDWLYQLIFFSISSFVLRRRYFPSAGGFERQIERYSSLTLLCYPYEGPEC